MAHPVGAVSYLFGYALAEEHLRQALTVIAESVNPLPVTPNMPESPLPLRLRRTAAFRKLVAENRLGL
ncbi:hypothetical protein [Nocardia beijingensis]